MKTTKKTSTLKRFSKMIGVAAASLLGLVLIVALSANLVTSLLFHSFLKDAKAEYMTPGLYEGLVPQGSAYVAEKDVYLHCGYMVDGSASRIYIIDAQNTDDRTYVELYTADGQPYTGHTGGITTAGDLVWLANDGDGDDNCVWVFSLKDILEAENGGRVTLTTKFRSETRAACCFADDEYLWVGEYNDGEKYVPSASHRFTVNGGEQYALVCAYPLDADSPYGIAYEEMDGKDVFTPALCLSVTDLVQGFIRIPQGFALSTSYGLQASHIYIYKDVTAEGTPDTTLSINGTDVPVYYLDETSLITVISMQPMSEGIFVKDDRLYVLFESACEKYVFGHVTKGRYVYSYAPDP